MSENNEIVQRKRAVESKPSKAQNPEEQIEKQLLTRAFLHGWINIGEGQGEIVKSLEGRGLLKRVEKYKLTKEGKKSIKAELEKTVS